MARALGKDPRLARTRWRDHASRSPGVSDRGKLVGGQFRRRLVGPERQERTRQQCHSVHHNPSTSPARPEPGPLAPRDRPLPLEWPAVQQRWLTAGKDNICWPASSSPELDRLLGKPPALGPMARVDGVGENSVRTPFAGERERRRQRPDRTPLDFALLRVALHFDHERRPLPPGPLQFIGTRASGTLTVLPCGRWRFPGTHQHAPTEYRPRRRARSGLGLLHDVDPVGRLARTGPALTYLRRPSVAAAAVHACDAEFMPAFGAHEQRLRLPPADTSPLQSPGPRSPQACVAPVGPRWQWHRDAGDKAAALEAVPVEV